MQGCLAAAAGPSERSIQKQSEEAGRWPARIDARRPSGRLSAPPMLCRRSELPTRRASRAGRGIGPPPDTAPNAPISRLCVGNHMDGVICFLETQGVPEVGRDPDRSEWSGQVGGDGGHRVGGDVLRGAAAHGERSPPARSGGGAWVDGVAAERTRLGLGTVAAMHREAATLVRQLGLGASAVLEQIATALERQDRAESMRTSRTRRRAA